MKINNQSKKLGNLLLSTASSIAIITSIASNASAFTAMPRVFLSKDNPALVNDVSDWDIYNLESGELETVDLDPIHPLDTLLVGGGAGAQTITMDYGLEMVNIDLLQHNTTIEIASGVLLTALKSTDGSKVGDPATPLRIAANASKGTEVDAKATINFTGDDSLIIIGKAPDFSSMETVDFKANTDAKLIFFSGFRNFDPAIDGSEEIPGDFVADIKSSNGSGGVITLEPNAKINFLGDWGEDNTGGGGDDERVKSLIIQGDDEDNTQITFAKSAAFSEKIVLEKGAIIDLPNGVNLVAPEIVNVTSSENFEIGSLYLHGNNDIKSNIGLFDDVNDYLDTGKLTREVSPLTSLKLEGDVTFEGYINTQELLWDTNHSIISLDGDAIIGSVHSIHGGTGQIEPQSDGSTILFTGMEGETAPVDIDINNHDAILAFTFARDFKGKLFSSGGSNGVVKILGGLNKLNNTWDDTDRLKDLEVDYRSTLVLGSDLYLSGDIKVTDGSVSFGSNVTTVDIGGDFLVNVPAGKTSVISADGNLTLDTIKVANNDTLILSTNGVAGKVFEVENITGINTIKESHVRGKGLLKIPVKDTGITEINYTSFDDVDGTLYLYHDTTAKNAEVALTLNAANPPGDDDYRVEAGNLTFGAGANKTITTITKDSEINHIIFNTIHIDDKLTLKLEKGVNLSTKNGIIDSTDNSKLHLVKNNKITSDVSSDVIFAGDGAEIVGDVKCENKFTLTDKGGSVSVVGDVDGKLVFFEDYQTLAIKGGFKGKINNIGPGAFSSSSLIISGEGDVDIDAMNKAAWAGHTSNLVLMSFDGTGEVTLPPIELPTDQLSMSGKKNLHLTQDDQLRNVELITENYRGKIHMSQEQNFDQLLGSKLLPVSVVLEAGADLHLRGDGTNYVNASSTSNKTSVALIDTNLRGDIGDADNPVGVLALEGNSKYSGKAYSRAFVQTVGSRANISKAELSGGEYLLLDNANLNAENSKFPSITGRGTRDSMYFGGRYNDVRGNIGRAKDKIHSINVASDSRMNVWGSIYDKSMTINNNANLSMRVDSHIDVINTYDGSAIQANNNSVEIGELNISGVLHTGVEFHSLSSHGQFILNPSTVTTSSGSKIIMQVYASDVELGAEYSNVKLVKFSGDNGQAKTDLISHISYNSSYANITVNDDGTVNLVGTGWTRPKRGAAVEQAIDDGVKAAIRNLRVNNTNVSEAISRNFERLDKAPSSEVKQQEFAERLTVAMTKPVVDAAAMTPTTAVGDVVGGRMNTFSMPTAVAAGEEKIPYGIWVQALGGKATQKITNNVASGYKSSLSGAVVGADTELSEQSSIGLVFAHANGKLNLRDAQLGDSIKTKSNMVAVYGQHSFTDNIFTQINMGYAVTNVDSASKRVSTNTTYDIATAKYKVKDFSSSVMGGYSFALNNNAFLVPMLGMKFNNTKQNTYTETGAGAQNLTVKVKHKNTFKAILGGRFTSEMSKWNMKLTPEMHAFLDYKLGAKRNASSAVNFENDNDKIYSNSAPAKRYSMNLGASVTALSGIVEYSIGYDMKLSSKYVGHQGSLKVRVNL